MPENIAVYLDESGRTASLEKTGKVVVYACRRGRWRAVREQNFSPGGCAGGLAELRRQMHQVLDFLGECRIFAALAVGGVAYFELEKAGLSVWEVAGRPADFLDYIWEEEAKMRLKNAGRAEDSTPPAPQKIAPGHYRISLIEVQSKNSGLTSKQLLLPWLRNRQFSMLEVVCSHVPPWLEGELASGGICGEIRKSGPGEYVVTIKKSPAG